jgi:glycosyltransferase involved in cell wall biosynthesis
MNNASLVGAPAAAQPKPAHPRLRVGYLANLSLAKGMADVLTIAERCEEDGLPIDFSIAGPFEDPADEPSYRLRCARLQNTEYLGPVYGDAKEAFWRQIDVFIFPTRYRNEAEPLVIHEALRSGAAVIAYARGCIADQVGPAGIAVPVEAEFVQTALGDLRTWAEDRERLRTISLAAVSQYSLLHSDSAAALVRLMKFMRRPEIAA